MADAQQLIEQLNGDAQARDKAEQALIDMGSAALDPLVAALNAMQEDLSRQILQHKLMLKILGGIKDPRVVPALIHELGLHPHYAHEIVKTIFVGMGSVVVEPLLAVLNTPDSRAFNSVISILGSFKDPRITPALVALLHNTDEQVRFLAALALADVGEQQAVAVLQELLMDKTQPNRWTPLMRALNKLGQRSVAIAFANQVLREESLSDRDRHLIFYLIAEWNDPATGDLLLYLLKQRREHFNDAQIVAALAKLKYLPAVDYLIESLAAGTPQWRGVVAQALGEMGDKRAIEPLKQLRSDKRVAWADDPREGPGRTVNQAAGEALRKLEPGWKIWNWF